MQKYPFEKYFYKNKDNIITNLKVNAHELYLIDRALAAENIKIDAVIDAQKENEEIIFLINKELPRHKNLCLANKEIIQAMEKQIKRKNK